MKNVAIIQARVGSARFPNKIFELINGQPMLWHVVNRARKIEGVDEVIVATSLASENRQIVDYCNRSFISVSRGGASSDDVLGRYADIAMTRLTNNDNILRITADCPMLDPGVSGNVLSLLLNTDVDYASNVFPATFPDGLDTEAFSFETLQKLDARAKSLKDREHVTRFIHNHPERYRIANHNNSANLSYLRWCVDYPEDLEFVREVYKCLGDDFGMDDVLNLLADNEHLMKINTGHTRNEGSK